MEQTTKHNKYLHKYSNEYRVLSTESAVAAAPRVIITPKNDMGGVLFVTSRIASVIKTGTPHAPILGMLLKQLR